MSQTTVLRGLVISAAVCLLPSCSDPPPPNRPAPAGSLAPCPDSPNCVSSLETRASKQVNPLRFPMSPQEAQSRLTSLLDATKRARIVVSHDGYVHAEFISRVFRFIDDVEFVLDPENGLLHMRSASRVGYYDFGVNRKRLAALAQRLLEMGFE